MAASNRLFALVLLCFLLSGFAALLYQTAWTREFAFVFGSSELAVSVVLAAYMGGLALGAAAAGRWAARVRRPVRVYAVLELGIGGCALLVPVALHAATALWVRLFGGLPSLPESPSTGAAAFMLVVSTAILVAPTSLMGATLPLLARHAVRRSEEIGARVGALYAVNTAGAVAGTVAAAFVLLPALGLRHTVHVGAAVNLLVFGAAAVLARRAPALPPAPAAAAREPGGAAWILPLVAVSGAVSFGYEVLWVRLLGHVLGASTYAFATMLASFLTGITLGSAAAARLARDPRRAAVGFAAAQLGTAALSLAAFEAVDALPALAAGLGAGATGSAVGGALLAGAVLLPPALCIGATFPFAVRLLARDAQAASAASGRVYAWNTVGAITGALGAGFWWLPALGFAGLVAAAVAMNLVLAGATALLARPRLRAAGVTALAGMALLAALPPDTPWALIRHSPLPGAGSGGEIVHYGVGRSSTVLLVESETGFTLTTSGLREASIDPAGARPGRFPTASWLTLLPALARPEADSLLLVGLGGGLALETPPRTFERIDVVEIEREVVRANRAIADRRAHDPLADPRVQIAVNDARGALLLSAERWDAIVSQPSHPWTAGSAPLYSREFFELARERLTPGGVFVQWIGLSLVDAPLLRTLVATLVETFPHVRVYRPHWSAVLFLASEAPLPVEERAARALAQAPADFALHGLAVPEDVAAALVLDEKGARRFASGAALNTDDHNLLAARGARLRVSLGRGADLMLAPYDPLVARLGRGEWDGLYLVRRLLRTGDEGRAARLAPALPDPVARRTAMGLVSAARGRIAEASGALAGALRSDPGSQEAAFSLLALRRELVEGGDRSVLPAGLDAISGAVAEGWLRAARSDWGGVRALEPVLASAGPRHPALSDARRLRARWRIERGDAERAAEALALAERQLAVAVSRRDLLLRARAAAGAGRPDAAVAAVRELEAHLDGRPAGRRAAAVALGVLERLGPQAPPELRARIAALAD